MEIYTVGFTQKSAAEFFDLLRSSGVRRLVDVRLNNVSQLAGFTKRDDLRFFLRELAGIEYVHEPRLAPTKELLDDYKKKRISWDQYAERFLGLMAHRRIEAEIDPQEFAAPTVLLCSEATAENCHRRLVVEYLQQHWPEIEARHL